MSSLDKKLEEMTRQFIFKTQCNLAAVIGGTEDEVDPTAAEISLLAAGTLKDGRRFQIGVMVTTDPEGFMEEGMGEVQFSAKEIEEL